MQYVMDNKNDGEIITFMRYEERFDAKYHFGAVEGLNCLEVKDVNVVGLGVEPFVKLCIATFNFPKL